MSLLLALTLTLPAGTLTGTPPAFAQSLPGSNAPRGPYVHIETHSTQEQLVIEDPDHPKPKRSTAWIVAGGVGMAMLASGMGGVISTAIDRSESKDADRVNHHPGNKGLAIGALVGLLPGLIFGNEARSENNATGRSVIVVLDVGGSLALLFGAAQIYRRGFP